MTVNFEFFWFLDSQSSSHWTSRPGDSTLLLRRMCTKSVMDQHFVPFREAHHTQDANDAAGAAGDSPQVCGAAGDAAAPCGCEAARAAAGAVEGGGGGGAAV